MKRFAFLLQGVVVISRPAGYRERCTRLRMIGLFAAVFATALQPALAQGSPTPADAGLEATMTAFYAAIGQANRGQPLDLAVSAYEPGAVIACNFLNVAESYHRDGIDEALGRRANGAYLIIGDTYRSESLAVMKRYAVDVEINTIKQRPAKISSDSGSESRLRVTTLWHQEDDGKWRVVFQEYAP